MLLFFDGFGNYNDPNIGALGKWQTFTTDGANITMTVAVNGGRLGGSALQVVAAGINSAATYLQRVLTAPLARVVVGMAVQVNVFDPSMEMPICAFFDISSGQVFVSVLPNGQIRFRSATSTGAILATSTASVINATGVPFYLEFDITFDTAAGVIVLHAEGVNVPLSASTGLDTAPSGNDSFNTFRLGFPSTGAVTLVANWWFADFYMLSTTGGANTTFLGDVRAVALFPSGAGVSTQFTPHGAATNWQCVNEHSEDGDTTYVNSGTVGNKDLYEHDALPPGAVVFGVQLESVARKDNIGTRSISNSLISDLSSLDGAIQPLTQSYAWYLDIVENDPETGAPWLEGAVDAMQFGVKVAA